MTQDIREIIANQVKNIEPHDEIEEDHQAAVLSWIASGADLFRVKKPDTPPRHLVAYFAVVDSKTDKMLLQDHLIAKLWLPPGGHVEPNENPVDTVKRECQEELGIEAEFLGEPKPHFVTVTTTNDDIGQHTDVSLWFVLKSDKEVSLKLEENKFADVKWWDIAEILNSPLELFDPELHRFCKKILTSVLCKI